MSHTLSRDIQPRDEAEIETSLEYERFLQYLAEKGCTLWMLWDISDENGRRDAAYWWCRERRRFTEWFGQVWMEQVSETYYKKDEENADEANHNLVR